MLEIAQITETDRDQNQDIVQDIILTEGEDLHLHQDQEVDITEDKVTINHY